MCWLFFKDYKSIFACSVISWHFLVAQPGEISPCELWGPVYFTVNTMAADDLVTQVAKASAAMVLILFFQNILA